MSGWTGGGGVQPAGAGGYRRPGAGGDGDGLRRFSGVHPVHLRPVRPHAAGLSGGGRDLNPLLQAGADFPPAAAVHGLCRLLGGLRLRHRRAAERASGQRVHPFCPPVDAGGVGVPDAGHRARLGVGLLRAGLGRLVVLGPVENASFMPWLAGTALLHSLAVTEQRAGFKAWTLLLSICAFSLCLLGTFRCARGAGVGARLRLRPGARNVYPRLYGAGHRRLAAAVRRAGTGCVRG